MENNKPDAGHALSVGKRFETIAELKQTIAAEAIADGFEYKTLRASDKRYEVKCKNPECNWKVLARAIGASSLYRIRDATLEHQCFGIHHRSHKNMTADFISNAVRERLTAKPDYSAADIVKDMRTEFGVEITYNKAWRAKEDAFFKINGSHEESFA